MNIEEKKQVLWLNEDRLVAWLVHGSPSVVKCDLCGSLEYVRRLRHEIVAEEPDFTSDFAEELRPWI
jgi:hypothetical protein